ncbi:MAG TPA: DUF3995 domain-containing protein [Vicinamibacterales bacterium]|nr:DUF3995 domain-containing protein [Vicinamibacterales bacterium]
MHPAQRQTTVRHYWIAWAAACWALVFAGFHVAWAAGWYIGLDPVAAAEAFAKPSMLAYDLVVVAMCILAAPVVLALAMPWGQRVPQRLLGTLAWTGTGLLVLRAVASLTQAVYLLVAGRFSLHQIGGWEPWFYLGATLFGINLWLHWRPLAQRAKDR